jgi:hypothetical protein
VTDQTPNWSVGQKVKIVRLNSRYAPDPLDGEVVKVARKYVTVAVDPYRREEQFDKETGYEKSDYLATRRIVTDEILAAEAERAELLKRLEAVDIAFRFGRNRLTNDQLRRIVAIAEES